jgi:hypothetical protein
MRDLLRITPYSRCFLDSPSDDDFSSQDKLCRIIRRLIRPDPMRRSETYSADKDPETREFRESFQESPLTGRNNY